MHSYGKTFRSLDTEMKMLAPLAYKASNPWPHSSSQGMALS